MNLVRKAFCAAVGLLSFVLALLFTGTCWIFYYFGPVSFWQILAHCCESPKYLPLSALVVIALDLAVCAIIGIGFAILVGKVFSFFRKRLRRGADVAAVSLVLFLCALVGGELFWWADATFHLREVVNNELMPTTLFSDHCRIVSPEEVSMPSARKNLIVIVSESLEQGFAEGLECGENIIPGLRAWQARHCRFLNQKQVLGTDHTAGALMSMFYGVPKVTYVRLCLDRLGEDYPRLSIPSIWDVLLDKGYNCLYCQGGDFEFASKKNLFPVHERMRLIGRSDLENDAEYVNERSRPDFGVQDEVTVRHFKDELLRLSRAKEPFAAVMLTLNTHGPLGWISSSTPLRFKTAAANCVSAQDAILSGFLDWLARQPFYDETSVVVLGDHLYWYRDKEPTDDRVAYNAVKPYEGFSGFESPPIEVSRHTAFATFDWAATLVELSGARLPADRKFGLGTSLFGDEPTLLEKIGKREFERLLQGAAADFGRTCLTTKGE